MTSDIKPGGYFLLNCSYSDEELDRILPASAKRDIANKNISFYVIDGIRIARELGLGGRVNTILQAAFFKLADIIPIEDAVKYMKQAAADSYGKKGERVVLMNQMAIDRGVTDLRRVNVPADWKDAADEEISRHINENDPVLGSFVDDILLPITSSKGNTIPVSTFSSIADGTFPLGTSAFEKRGIAIDVPMWIPENCIQCNRCSFVCPHAAIRPAALSLSEKEKAPGATIVCEMNGVSDILYNISCSVLDCTGCGVCAQVCPGSNSEKALVMVPRATQADQQAVFDYCSSIEEKPDVFKRFPETTVKGSQFKKPLLEFSGACAGCGESPYSKLVTQLFGDRMYIAAATGCSSIWGGSAPSIPYTKNSRGKGPAWANSLFEDNAEYSFGMMLGQKAIRERQIDRVANLLPKLEGQMRGIVQDYLDTIDDGPANQEATARLIAALEDRGDSESLEILSEKDYLSKKSFWAFGGDGWAYDIGFGGLDHVLASGEDINILVLDTEVYSNTGGQSSKATPTGAVAQFAASGKATKKKDLASICMSYGYVYVAQVAMGADYAQCIKAFTEAESYHGPSIVIAYAPCINHGIQGGMGNTMNTMLRAVQSGYWHLFRFDPRKISYGQNPFTLDSRQPKQSYRDFAESEVRYNSLKRTMPQRANELLDTAARQAADRYEYLSRYSRLFEEE